MYPAPSALKKAQNRFIATSRSTSRDSLLNFISKWNPRQCEKLLLWKHNIWVKTHTLGQVYGDFRSAEDELGFLQLPDTIAEQNLLTSSQTRSKKKTKKKKKP